jgi:hypothetical protein
MAKSVLGKMLPSVTPEWDRMIPECVGIYTCRLRKYTQTISKIKVKTPLEIYFP